MPNCTAKPLAAEEVVDFKITEVCLGSAEVVLQQGTLAVNQLRCDFSQ